MTRKPRLFISVPDDRHLDDRRRRLKKAILGFIEKQGLEIVGFESEQWNVSSAPTKRSWSVDGTCDLLKRCDGVVVLALARNYVYGMTQTAAGLVQPALDPFPLPSPYNHLEGGLAIARGLPVLVFHEDGMDRTGLFTANVKPQVIPENADESWASSRQFRKYFDAWKKQVFQRRDVFLGYCSKASTVAVEIREFLEDHGFSVVDWTRDFKPAGATILDEIERAADRCRCAIFLFTKDDEVKKSSRGKASFKAIPRDNVLLEAGFFTRSHGKDRVAIVREEDSKMPADFGGIIYLSFKNRKKLKSVKDGLLRFMEDALDRGDA